MSLYTIPYAWRSHVLSYTVCYVVRALNHFHLLRHGFAGLRIISPQYWRSRSVIPYYPVEIYRSDSFADESDYQASISLFS